MKIFKYFLLFSLLFSQISKAQEKGDLEYGFAIGPSLTAISDINNIQTDPILTYHARVSGEYYFTDIWGIRAEVYYDNKGYGNGFLFDNNNNSTETDFNLSYVSIPLLAAVHFGNNNNWYANFGPYVSFLIDAEATETGTDVTEAFNENDLGIFVALGYKFKVSDKLKLSLEFNGDRGFINAFNENSDTSVFNRKSALSIGLLF